MKDIKYQHVVLHLQEPTPALIKAQKKAVKRLKWFGWFLLALFVLWLFGMVSMIWGGW